MDDLVEPGRSPCPRLQHILVEALRENPLLAKNGVAVEPSDHDHQSNRPARHGQIGQAPMIPAVDSPRVSPAFRTGAGPAHGAGGDQHARIITRGVDDNKAARDQGRWPETLHSIGSLRETSAS
jgi:hypothetical protein